MTNNNTSSSPPLKGYIVSSNIELIDSTLAIWNPEHIVWTVTDDVYAVMDSLLSSPPNLILLDMDYMGVGALEILRLLKEENVYRTVSVVLCLSEESIHKYDFDWATIEADDVLLLPTAPEIIKIRLELLLGRASRSLDSNPLTYLPGNNSIIKFVQNALNKRADFALVYADLDNFKAFNDKYGFARGDEILMLTGRLISSTIASEDHILNFVGHIGGDDFIFCLPPDKAEEACVKIINTFDGVVSSFYDEDDRIAGMITSTDRQGNSCTFPIMGISIAVVFNISGKTEHYGQLAERAAQIKKKAKQQTGSAYVLDKRNYAPKPINCDENEEE